MNSRDQYQTFCDQLSPYTETVIPDFRRFIHVNEKRMEENMKEFYEDAKKIPTEPISKLSDIMNDSIIVGEMHNHISPKRFLIEKMKEFKEAGFEILFMEHLYYDDQKSLDDFHKTGLLDDKLWSRLYELSVVFKPRDARFKEKDEIWDMYDFTSIVVAAQEAGIRVVGIDTFASYLAQDGHKKEYGGLPYGDPMDNFRIRSMNYTACKIIQKETKDSKCKWLALMGNAHVKTCEGVPGVAELTGSRAMSIADSTSELSVSINAAHEVRGTKGMVDVLIRMQPDQSTPSLKYQIKSSENLSKNQSATFSTSSKSESSAEAKVETKGAGATSLPRKGSDS